MTTFDRFAVKCGIQMEQLRSEQASLSNVFFEIGSRLRERPTPYPVFGTARDAERVTGKRATAWFNGDTTGEFVTWTVIGYTVADRFN